MVSLCKDANMKSAVPGIIECFKGGGKMKQKNLPRIIFRVPKELKKKFVLKCVRKGWTQQSVLCNFLDKFVMRKRDIRG